MTRKRGPPRTSSPRRRRSRFKSGYTHHTVPRHYKEVMPLAKTLLEAWLLAQEDLEQVVMQVLQDEGVPSSVWDYYLTYARRKQHVLMNFTSATRDLELTSLDTEFELRGLDPDVLKAIENELVPPTYWTLDVSKLGINTRLAPG